MERWGTQGLWWCCPCRGGVGSSAGGGGAAELAAGGLPAVAHSGLSLAWQGPASSARAAAGGGPAAPRRQPGGAAGIAAPAAAAGAWGASGRVQQGRATAAAAAAAAGACGGAVWLAAWPAPAPAHTWLPLLAQQGPGQLRDWGAGWLLTCGCSPPAAACSPTAAACSPPAAAAAAATARAQQGCTALQPGGTGMAGRSAAPAHSGLSLCKEQQPASSTVPRVRPRARQPYAASAAAAVAAQPVAACLLLAPNPCSGGERAPAAKSSRTYWGGSSRWEGEPSFVGMSASPPTAHATPQPHHLTMHLTTLCSPSQPHELTNSQHT